MKFKLKEKNAKLRNENSDLSKWLDNFVHGLDDFNVSKALFSLVKLEFAMKRKKINPSEMLTLCLMRLRLDKAVVDLCNRFQKCKSTVSKVFFGVLDVLFVKL